MYLVKISFVMALASGGVADGMRNRYADEVALCWTERMLVTYWEPELDLPQRRNR